jgi:adenylate cyclase
MRTRPTRSCSASWIVSNQGPERTSRIGQTLGTLDAVIRGIVGDPDLDADDKRLLASLQMSRAQLQELVIQTGKLRDQLGQLRGDLHQKLGGKAVFLGGTATGNPDFHPTSLHFACPGVVIHGAVFNAIMTGKMWRRASPWADASATLGVGLLVAALVTGLSPARGLLATVLVVIGYLAFNGYVLFDYGNLILDAAGPAVAGPFVWGGLTLANFITERAERSRITRRFRSYVDPALVDFVLNHPEQSRFDGEVREMSMGFTDLVSFTALTERLAERTVPLLGEYMGEMVPVIRSHRGYVSKLMGDGIYFFFGAPGPDPHHAANAVATVLDMRKALAALNQRLVSRGLPRLEMRAGVSTGKVVIGDAGPADASDYTAMGDPVNLASRLESANKVFGTHVLITDRTLALAGDAFLVRPIALLQVLGKTEGTNVYEPLARCEEATEEQRVIAESTAAAISAFQKARFADALVQLGRLEAMTGTDKLIHRRISVARWCSARSSNRIPTQESMMLFHQAESDNE